MSSLTSDQIKILKDSIPFLKSHGVELTADFYQYMFKTYPPVLKYFNQAHQASLRQPTALAYSLLKYAENIEDLTPLLPFVRLVVEKHVGLQVLPDHYKIVGECLLKTLKEKVGDGATPEFMKAWEVAFTELADIFIGLEDKRYKQLLKINENSWLDFKNAKVVKLEQNSSSIKNIYIALQNPNEKLAGFLPGQYITIRIILPDGSETQREYSLSNDIEATVDYYRISVRRIPNGVVSNHIHDNFKIGSELKITSPYGNMFESLNILKPSIFFIGGIGITPMISLLDFFIDKIENPELVERFSHLFNDEGKHHNDGERTNYFLYSNQSADTRGFGDWLNSQIKANPSNLVVKEFISKPESGIESLENHEVHHRRINASDLDFINDEIVNTFNYIALGPETYMREVERLLEQKGVDKDSIITEFFGVGGYEATH